MCQLLKNFQNSKIHPFHDRPIPFPFPVTAVKLAKSRLLGSIPINCSRLKLPYPDTYTQITSAYLAPSRIREAVKKNKRALNAKGVERDEAREGRIKREREKKEKKRKHKCKPVCAATRCGTEAWTMHERGGRGRVSRRREEEGARVRKRESGRCPRWWWGRCAVY